jgi:translation initiation factor IF-2
MKKTMEQTIQDNLIKIEKLSAIYKQVDDYAKEISGMSIKELNDSIYVCIEENSILNDIRIAEEYEQLNN